MHPSVTFLNFDNTYTWQRNLLRFPHEWIDMYDIEGTNLYCDDDAIKEIEKRIARRHTRGMTLIGSGNYHYVSYVLLKQFHEPFTLVLFDHHTDMNEQTLFPLLSCGSWVSYAQKNVPTLKHVVIIGSATSYVSSHVTTFPKNDVMYAPMTIVRAIPTKHVYISIDKDVLRPQDAQTNWDQGTMSLQMLLTYIDYLFRYKHVLGVDVCGEDRTFCVKNEQANEAIIRACFKHMPISSAS
ncbi:arginase family protein [Anoxybacillus ayderensis]|uniref:arginase family protein n=1 Tax=Anoxybacillus ayderensis TaxID=265546 RepID=UPI002E1F64D5|nr:arginase family protein [Anoxybacillus ayderensis]MED0687476.1 arginase family protein [Anoxybacillus ayderensis]